MPDRIHARHVLSIIEQEIVAYKQSCLPQPHPGWPIEVRVLMTAIGEHLVEPGLRLVELERELGLRDHNVSTLFRECVGMTPKQYQLNHRITLAQRLLRHPAMRAMSITQIAGAVGFEHPEVFSRQFKQHVGCTPSQYRQQCN